MTLGTSISYDALGNSYTSGSYTTNATSIDGYGTVKASQTIGKSGRDIGLATEKILGTYTTESTFGDDGQQVTGSTTGSSKNLAGKDTGSYTTTSTFDPTYGVLSTQVTLGTSISYDALGNSYTSGSYTTNATSIDGYGTVKASETIGKSGRDIGLATEKILGTYTTESTFGDDGQQVTGSTTGSSKNLAGKDTGSYTTTSTFDPTYEYYPLK